MTYRILLLVSGLRKEIIENGVIITKKLIKGDIVETATLDKKELQSGYYKVIKDKIIRERKVINNDDTNKQLTTLIEGMKTMLGAAELVLSNINKNEASVAVPTEDKEDFPIVSEVALETGEDIPEEFIVNEDEAINGIYNEEDYRNGNIAYDNLLRNTLISSMGGPNNPNKNIDKIGSIANKPIPKISEINLGKATSTFKEEKKIPVIYDHNNKIANDGLDKIVDLEKNVISGLGIKIINR